ncbi:winged helix-turn-helix domain-containing protein [Thermococcus gorgonarius]|uniref:ArnR1-like winged helix-turn-helix domain-containing protein n=1 Tax=Thermococcus gorgonarius TaxID=71997 RepID=A0A2Z2MG06_THEGO|nr:winged helix-turn-helix domain-containing protein [Thermococcus gorgonarius]ASJ01391.1 hypothetical protein A3K92_07805 [Thermococcus gorgonarius]
MRRSKVEIIADIIRSTNGVGATKTQIVYRANLNFKLATKYLEHLLESGYIQEAERNGRKVFVSTEKGQAFLRKFFEIARDLDAFL